MDINQGVMYLTLGVIPTFSETWTRDFYKKKRIKKETETNVCIKR